MSQAGTRKTSNRHIESFRNYNKPKKRKKIKLKKRKILPKTTKGFKKCPSITLLKKQPMNLQSLKQKLKLKAKKFLTVLILVTSLLARQWFLLDQDLIAQLRQLDEQ